MKIVTKILFVSLLTFLSSSLLLAGNTGKIIGKVTDATSGEPLIGVNVLVIGTTRGGVTDMDGNYSIIGVPIGSYSVKASQVGYAPVEVKNVKVGADETTSLNFKLLSSEVQITGVTITADQQLVNKNATTGTQTMSDKAIASIPNVKSVEDVLKLQAGVVRQGSNIFVRGGRANEIQYLVDGVPTNSIVGNSGDLATTSKTNEELSRLYSGQQSSIGGGLSVGANAIQSVSVQTSGFDADYGNAQSGIINITTKSGGDKYSGSIQYRTDRIFGNNQNEAYTAFSFGGPEPLTKFVFPELGFKLPGSLSFFVSGDMSRSDGAVRFAHNEFYNPIQRRIEVDGFLGGILNTLGFYYRDNQNNAFTVNSKVKYDISGDDQLSYGYRASIKSRHGYSTTWKYRADSSSLGMGLSIQNNLQWQHFFSPKSFFKFYIAKLESRDGNDVAGIKPPDYSSADPTLLDPNSDGFNELGTSQRWYSSRTTQWSTRFDYNSQVHPLHLLKTGLEFYLEHINSTEIVSPTKPHGDIIPPDTAAKYSHGDYPGYGEFRYHMNQLPNHGAMFLQDNIELAGLNLHVGLRYDFFDLGAQVYRQDFVEQWMYTYHWVDTLDAAKRGQHLPDWVWNMPGNTDSAKYANGQTDSKRFWYFLTHGYFSPRLSIGYPVTDRIVFYFNYGHFLQYPERDQYYRDPFVAEAKAIIGNPNLKPQRTVQYEAGFDDQFSDDMAFGVHAFYKDVFDLAAVAPRGDFRVYRNLDYASTRGFEITLNQAFAGNFSGALSYTYQIAKGRSSSPLGAVLDPSKFNLPRETRLDWDQNHTANLFLTYKVSPQEEGTWGLSFMKNYSVSLTWSYGSGYPYHGYIAARANEVQYNRKVNSETSPYTTTVNLSIYKGVKLTDNINMMFTLDVTNLLNRKNPTKGGIFNYTGRVYQYGDLNPESPSSGVILPWYLAESTLLDPNYFEPPRQILFGVKLNWD